jgi:hypothetical protein
MPRTSTPSFKKLTSVQVVALSDAFRKHIIVKDDGSIYEDGWNDERIGKEVIPHYPGNIQAVVASYRKNLGFGSLYSKNEKHTDRLDKLELRVLELEHTISNMKNTAQSNLTKNSYLERLNALENNSGQAGYIGRSIK